MHTPYISRRLLWLIPAAGLLACSRKESQAQTPPPAAAAPAPPPPAPVTASLTAKNNSGITGTVTLTASGDSTQIALTLNGARNGQTYPGHIHFGTCDKPGGVVVPLTSVKVDSNKTGSSTTTVPTSVLDTARAQHGSLIEQSHTSAGRPVACGEIPAN